MVGSLVLPYAAQGVADQRRSDEACADSIPAFAHERGQPFAGVPALFGVSEQAKLQDQRIRSLGVAQYAPGRSDVLGFEGVADLSSKLQVVGFIVCPAQHVRRLSEPLGRVR